jgi:integrase
MKLDQKTIAALDLPGGKSDVIHFDDDLKGFGYRLRAGAGGKVIRSWLVQYRRAGASRRLLLGPANVLTPEQARAAAKKALAKVALGEDPQGDRADRRSKDQLTRLDTLVKEYLAAKKSEVRPRTFAEAERYLTGSYFKPLHAIPVDTVSRKDIAARIVVVTRESGTVAAARARAALSSFYAWAMMMGLVEHNPVIGALKPKDSEKRAHVLTDYELAAVYRACGDDDFGRVVRLLIITGCRRQEIGGIAFSELDAESGTWTLPAQRSKNGREHTLPLPPLAWGIIEGVPHRASRDRLFGLHADEGFTFWALKTEFDKILGDAVRPYRLHDLRRSVATGMANIGIAPHVIEQILNHRSGHKRGVAGIYNRSSYEREVKAALALWADHVRSIVDGGKRRLLLLPRGANAT